MNIKKFISFILVLSLIFSISATAFAAGTAAPKAQTKEKANRTITTDVKELSVYVGKYAEIKAEVENVSASAPEKTTLVWSSSDEKIATVTPSGKVTGVANGSAVISCKAEDDEKISAEVKVEVLIPVSKLKLEEDTMELTISDFDSEAGKGTIKCVIEPEDASVKDVEFSSDNEEVATVDENGNVTAVAPGRASITVVSKDTYLSTPISVKCKITVTKGASAVELDKTEMTIVKKSYGEIKATVLDEDTTNKNLIWESADESIATVTPSGKVAGVACGTTTIKCTSESTPEVSAECKVTVVQPVTGLKYEMAGRTVVLNYGESMTCDITVEPEDATNKNVKWESSDASIVSVDNNGKLTAVACGYADISCTAADGSEKSFSFKVHVPSIKIEQDSYTITDKEGINVSVVYYGDPKNISIEASDSKFYMRTVSTKKTADGGTEYVLWFNPHTAGSSCFDVKDAADPANYVRIGIEVAKSATYDVQDFPQMNYQRVAETPSKYYGDPCSIYGRVLQVGKGFLRVGVGGYGYFRDPVFVLIPDDYDGPELEYEDMVQIFGMCVGNETYTSILLQNITIPAMVAEKVIIRITKWDK